MTQAERSGWEITFTDILILLFTFLVFIIAVSSFEDIEYKKFWETESSGEAERPPREPATTSFMFDLIRGLKLPGLSEAAMQLLNELAPMFTNSDFEGVDVNYDENKITLMVSEQLSFEEDEYDLNKAVKPLLLKLVNPINQSKFDVNIEGHTDALINPRVNKMELSLNRALVVARFLIANGVDKGKISVSGYGPYRPIDTNKTVEGRQRNRRVEVHIIIRND
ncbi:MAG: OmpA family protein [Candidatus Aminicenantes bacterium]|jgi:chemotaxis protein MotB